MPRTRVARAAAIRGTAKTARHIDSGWTVVATSGATALWDTPITLPRDKVMGPIERLWKPRYTLTDGNPFPATSMRFCHQGGK